VGCEPNCKPCELWITSYIVKVCTNETWDPGVCPGDPEPEPYCYPLYKSGDWGSWKKCVVVEVNANGVFGQYAPINGNPAGGLLGMGSASSHGTACLPPPGYASLSCSGGNNADGPQCTDWGGGFSAPPYYTD
jgi:hypothetical protein